MTHVKTAREVAEGAQDEMLIKAGLQRSPAQLIKKVTRSDFDVKEPPMHFGKTAGVCSECQRKKIRCFHKHIEHDVSFGTVIPTIEQDEVDDSSYQSLFPNLHRGGGASTWDDETEDIKPDLTQLASQQHKHGRPSRWRERRAEEDAKLAPLQKTNKPAVNQVRDSDAISRRKPGRPVGWRKEMGISYAEFKRLCGSSEL